ncbi:MAG: alpha/beta hydrolase [Crocinitomicaceae bacterium]|nr:alpha/beta hydrolase [Crocinitomicaceae bacterium]
MRFLGENIELNYKEIVPADLRNDSVIALFIHEALGSIGQWKSFPQQLCDELGVRGIVYDRQGHGKSSKFSSERNERYLHNYALDELPPFADSVIPDDKKILLIGHSDGGTISLLFDHIFPSKIVGMVTMAAHVINEPETIAGIQPAVDAYKLGKLDGLKKYHSDKTEDLFYAWANIWRDERFVDWDITEEIGSNTPGLFIQGKEDQYGTPKQLELIKTCFPNGKTLLMEDCGHHPHLEKGNRVIAEIRQFFTALD